MGLIGPNGSGKTTALNLITGFIKPTRGTVTYQGADVTGAQPHDLARIGLVRTFQITTLFENLTVRDNVLHGSHLANPTSLVGALTKSKRYQEQGRLMEERVRELLGLVGLEGRIEAVASDLSAGRAPLPGDCHRPGGPTPHAAPGRTRHRTQPGGGGFPDGPDQEAAG